MSSLEFRFKKIDEIRNLIEDINHNDLMSFSSYCLCFNFCNWFINFCSCRYYEFCSRNKICAVTSGIKKYKSVIKKKKKHDKIVLLGKYTLNTTEALTSLLRP